jgi:glutamate--cysteine ligase
VIYPGERPLHALRERGVEYIEVRLMDLDPFVPVGIKAETMDFLDVFLLHCLQTDSPPDSPAEIAELARNQHRTAARGREPGLMLERAGQELGLTEWGAELVAACAPLAAKLDAAHATHRYSQALAAATAALQAPETLPSARVLATMQGFDNSFVQFVRAQSVQTQAHFLQMPWTAEQQAGFEAMTQQSVAEQKKIEAADTMPFEIYREKYLSANRLGQPAQVLMAAG